MTRRLLLALAPAAMAFATLAHAQPAGPPPMHGPPPGPPSAEMKARHEAMRTQHIEDLRTILRLRPDQEPALMAFLDAHKPQIHEIKGPPEPKALTTPQRLDEMARHDSEMSAQHQRMRDALARFYAALSPEQQKVFDALQRLKAPHAGSGGPMMMQGRPMGDHGGGPRMIMMRRGGPDGPTPGHEPPR